MVILILLFCAVALQFIAAYLALRLARLTVWRTTWLLIAAAIVLMAVRRSVTLAHVTVQTFNGWVPGSHEWIAESVTLAISLLMVAGLSRFAPSVLAGQRAEAALRESEERLRQAIRVSDIGIFDHDHLADTIYWSPMERRLFGWGPDEPVTLEKFLASVYPADLARIRAAVQRAHDPSGDGLYDVEHRIVRRDGEIRWLSTRSQTIFDGAGAARRPVRTVGANVDVTERKRAEEAIAASEKQLRTIFDAEPECVKITDLDGRLIEMNAAGLAMIEADGLDQVRGHQVSQLVLPKYRGAYERLTRLAGEGKPGELELEIRGLRGTHRWLKMCVVPLSNDGNGPTTVLGITRDVTAQKQAETALREHAERLELLSRRLVEAQEAEGRRIGRELHDDLGQILTTLKLTLQPLQLPADGRWVPTASAMVALVDQAILRVRNLSTVLRPAILDDLGLEAALRWFLDRQAQQGGFNGVFIARGMEQRLPPEIETTCFRIVQEALTNAVRHARAQHVRIDLARRNGLLQVQVNDDGVGFDPKAARAAAMRGQSLGLIGMEERAALVNGRLDIRSAPGRGTVLRLRIPVAAKAARRPPVVEPSVSA